VSLEQVIGEINEFVVGWVAYFRHAECKGHLEAMDQWLRRRLRCYRLKACKRVKAIADFLHHLGVPKRRAWIGALSGKGWWRVAGSPPAMEGMSLAWFESQGLVSLVRRHEQLKR
jgi:RNA-directed DNA polymerase